MPPDPRQRGKTHHQIGVNVPRWRGIQGVDKMFFGINTFRSTLTYKLLSDTQ
ncbi:MAG: hypothetical protein H6557_20625 [Lewinellaceae bacterium]|nr:hypothetical protein [Phaeodactylibacter sp.]MCB9039025.1 hypothetical protein [Lewinellaceae bacterium]